MSHQPDLTKPQSGQESREGTEVPNPEATHPEAKTSEAKAHATPRRGATNHQLVAQEKRALRARMGALRKQRAATDSDNAGAHQARDLFLNALHPPAGAIISGYWPMRDELDPRPLLLALHERCYRIALPVVGKQAQPLTFRHWTPDLVLQEGRFATMAPPETSEVLRPDWLLVPLLAFDRGGYRLGYGGGFYDRTLAGMAADGHRVVSVGLAYAAQEEKPFLPHEPFDRPLDYIVSECEVLRARRAT